MEFKKIGTLTLNIFDKENIDHLKFIKNLFNDPSIIKRFQCISVSSLNNPKKEFFEHAFLVSHNDNLVGYISTSSINKIEHFVYLRLAIAKQKRGKGYGKTLLNEITEYIFNKYPEVKSIHLKIAKDNKPSLMASSSCGYTLLKDDFYVKNNPYTYSNKVKTIKKF